MERFLQDGKSIKKVLSDFTKGSRFDQKMHEITLNKHWEELAGSLIARHTTSLWFYRGKLTLKMDSAPLKQELIYQKSVLIDKINKAYGQAIITELVVR